MSYRGTRRAELIAARRCTWSTSVLVLRTEQFSSRKSSVLPISKLSRLFLQCWFLLGSSVRAHTVRCASRSTVRPSKGLPASCTTFLLKKKKEQPLANRKIQEPPEKERFLQEQGTGELERVIRWASFTGEDFLTKKIFVEKKTQPLRYELFFMRRDGLSILTACSYIFYLLPCQTPMCGVAYSCSYVLLVATMQARLRSSSRWIALLGSGFSFFGFFQILKLPPTCQALSGACLSVSCWKGNFDFLCSFLNNYPWTLEKKSFFNKL